MFYLSSINYDAEDDYSLAVNCSFQRFLLSCLPKSGQDNYLLPTVVHKMELRQFLRRKTGECYYQEKRNRQKLEAAKITDTYKKKAPCQVLYLKKVEKLDKKSLLSLRSLNVFQEIKCAHKKALSPVSGAYLEVTVE